MPCDDIVLARRCLERVDGEIIAVYIRVAIKKNSVLLHARRDIVLLMYALESLIRAFLFRK